MEKEEMFVCGLPYSEVVKILTIYKATGHLGKDYIEGFQDGFNKAMEEVKEIQDKTIRELIYKARYME